MHVDHASFGPIVASVSLGPAWHMHFRPRRARPHVRHALPSDELAGYRVEGYTRFQMKVGDDPHRGIDRIRRVAKEVRAGDIPVADANMSRKQHEAMHVAAAVGDQTRERPACRP